jgi:uncharacterized protein YabN with tetrapyrrole methylase and pyrophosphatase domain
VFGKVKVKDVAQVWANWDKIKRAEKEGTRHARTSALDGIPKHLPALLRAEKLIKKARKAKLIPETARRRALTKTALAKELLALSQSAQEHGWSAEELLRAEVSGRERSWRRQERRNAAGKP